MTTQVTLGDITIHRVVEQEGSFYPAQEFFPTLTTELLAELPQVLLGPFPQLFRLHQKSLRARNLVDTGSLVVASANASRARLS